MSTRPDQNPPAVESDDPDEIRTEIEETRADLGETVEALAAKTDVKAQLGQKQDEAKAKAAEVKEKLSHITAQDVKDVAQQVPAKVQERRKPVLISLAVLGAWMLRRRRKRQKQG